jgi:ribosomal-protein-alanine N-acetyltransferase
VTARPMVWHIEPAATEHDIDGIMAVEAESFTNPWTREMHAAEFNNRGASFVYVARTDDQRIVGFCSFWLVADEVHINNLAVLPSARRTGMASALLERALGDGVRCGAVRATLEVRRSNEAARQLYERLGFQVAGVRRDYYTHPVEDALILWRHDLSGPS